MLPGSGTDSPGRSPACRRPGRRPSARWEGETAPTRARAIRDLLRDPGRSHRLAGGGPSHRPPAGSSHASTGPVLSTTRPTLWTITATGRAVPSDERLRVPVRREQTLRSRMGRWRAAGSRAGGAYRLHRGPAALRGRDVVGMRRHSLREWAEDHLARPGGEAGSPGFGGGRAGPGGVRRRAARYTFCTPPGRAPTLEARAAIQPRPPAAPWTSS